MKTKRAIIISIATVAFVLAAIFGIVRQTQPVRAQDQPPPVPDRISFGMVGITAGQTVRINIANTIMPNDLGWPPGPIRVVMSFRGMNGQLIRNRNGEVVRKAVDLEHSGVHSFRAILGSSASRNASPSMLTLSTVRARSRPA